MPVAYASVIYELFINIHEFKENQRIQNFCKASKKKFFFVVFFWLMQTFIHNFTNELINEFRISLVSMVALTLEAVCPV